VIQKILIDSSGLVAIADRRSRAHSTVAAIIEIPTNEIVIPAPAVPEASYVIATRMGHVALRHFVNDLALTSPRIEDLTSTDYLRIAEVLNTYADLQLDFVDASILAVAERLNIQHILTLDRRDFRVLRPRHCEYLELLP
jgi:predicted nucleic acid-binding protein